MADVAEGRAGIVLDVTGMQSPENLLAVLRKVTELAKGAVLEVHMDSNPFQLYDLLQQRGYLLEMSPEANGKYRGRIKPRDTAAH